jgi:hypothetical protein
MGIWSAEMAQDPPVLIVAKGWLGDTLACTAAASSLAEQGFAVEFYHRWPQLDSLFQHETRFKTRRYQPRLLPLLRKTWGLSGCFRVIEEPIPWSYEEPFTAEIRRMSGCEPLTEFFLTRPNQEIRPSLSLLSSRPRICISRDIKKRSYGRDIDELVSLLSEFAEVSWIGLNPELDSKKGRRSDMEADIKTLLSSDVYFGPEGGMLWLAAGLGVRTIYLTEHVHALEEKFGPGVHKTLGMVNVFPKGNHIALAPGLPNKDLVKTIADVLAPARVVTIPA